MDVFVVLKTADRGSNGFEASVVAVYSDEKTAAKCVKLFTSQVAKDLQNKILYSYSATRLQEGY